MKKRLFLITMTLAACLAGCSKKEDVLKTVDGQLYMNKTPVYVEELSPTTAVSTLAGGDYKINYSYHPDFTSCTNNGAGVAESDVTVLDKKNKITYFSMYLGSQWCMHKQIDDGFICGFVSGEADMNQSLVVQQMQKEIEGLDFTKTYTKAVMDDVIEVTNFENIKLRPNEIVIPGILMVGKGNGQMDKTAQIGDVTVGFKSTDKYDFYQWNNYVIKAVKGYDVNQCITLKTSSK